MKYVSYFRVNAQEDLDSAHTWYEKQRAGLGDEFCEALEKAVDRIEQNPKGFAKIYRDFHLVPVNRFPYVLIYLVRGERIDVEAVWHTHRDPDGWKKRLRGNGNT